jgi:hypothetical protein
MTVGGNGVNIGGTDGAVPAYPFQVHTASSDLVMAANGSVSIGPTSTAAQFSVSSAVTTTISFAHSGTATTTVIEGTASSTACHVMYANGTASSFQVIAGFSYYYNTNNCT